MGTPDLNIPQALVPGAKQGKRTLKQMTEERDHVLVQTRYFYGIEQISLRDTGPTEYERFHSRIHTSALAAREVGRYVAASPGGREIGKSLGALTTPEGDAPALSLGSFFPTLALSPVAVRCMADETYDSNPGINDRDER